MVEIKTLNISWDLPVPDGYGRSTKWRSVRVALNEMYTKNRKNLAILSPFEEGASDEDKRKIGERIRSNVHVWKTAMINQGNKMPKIFTKVEFTDANVIVHVVNSGFAVE